MIVKKLRSTPSGGVANSPGFWHLFICIEYLHYRPKPASRVIAYSSSDWNVFIKVWSMSRRKRKKGGRARAKTREQDSSSCTLQFFLSRLLSPLAKRSKEKENYTLFYILLDWSFPAPPTFKGKALGTRWGENNFIKCGNCTWKAANIWESKKRFTLTKGEYYTLCNSQWMKSLGNSAVKTMFTTLLTEVSMRSWLARQKIFDI